MTTAILLVALWRVACGLPTVADDTQDVAPASVPAASAPVDSGSKRAVTVRLRHVKAAWHATGRNGLYAAACRPLRRALGPDWRGQRVLVSRGRKAIEVKLNDWCRSRRRKTIDLSDEAFRFFAPLRRGVIRVTIEGFR